MNNMLKLIIRLAPSTKLALLAARLFIKKQLAHRLASGGDRDVILDFAVSNHSAVATV